MTPAPVAPNWSKDMVDQANKRWSEFWSWCDSAGVPLPLREALLRDMLASIEGLRTANMLQAYIPALRGRSQ
jgi:hypothetical protein